MVQNYKSKTIIDLNRLLPLYFLNHNKLYTIRRIPMSSIKMYLRFMGLGPNTNKLLDFRQKKSIFRQKEPILSAKNLFLHYLQIFIDDTIIINNLFFRFIQKCCIFIWIISTILTPISLYFDYWNKISDFPFAIFSRKYLEQIPTFFSMGLYVLISVKLLWIKCKINIKIYFLGLFSVILSYSFYLANS